MLPLQCVRLAPRSVGAISRSERLLLEFVSGSPSLSLRSESAARLRRPAILTPLSFAERRHQKSISAPASGSNRCVVEPGHRSMAKQKPGGNTRFLLDGTDNLIDAPPAQLINTFPDITQSSLHKFLDFPIARTSILVPRCKVASTPCWLRKRSAKVSENLLGASALK